MTRYWQPSVCKGGQGDCSQTAEGAGLMLVRRLLPVNRFPIHVQGEMLQSICGANNNLEDAVRGSAEVGHKSGGDQGAQQKCGKNDAYDIRAPGPAVDFASLGTHCDADFTNVCISA